MVRAFIQKSGLSHLFMRRATAFAPLASRYRVRVMQEITNLNNLQRSTTERLEALESRWVVATDCLSRQGITFISEARHIQDAIEKRQRKLAMLLELGEQAQLAQALELVGSPLRVETEDFSGPQPAVYTVNVESEELPAVVNVLVSWLERETEQFTISKEPSRRPRGTASPELVNQEGAA